MVIFANQGRDSIEEIVCEEEISSLERYESVEIDGETVIYESNGSVESWISSEKYVQATEVR